MQNSVITASGALLAALIGLSGALWATISNQRKQQQAQRDNWTYDRRKDAYLAFIDAARAFIPLTEKLFLDEERDYVAQQANGTNQENETLEEETTWADILWSPFPADYSDGWLEEAPKRLHTLTMAFDRIDLEGPPDVTATALRIIESAHILIAGPELFPEEAKLEAAAGAKKAEQLAAANGEETEPMAAAGGGATEMNLRRTEVHRYRSLCGKFRKQAKKELGIPDS